MVRMVLRPGLHAVGGGDAPDRAVRRAHHPDLPLSGAPSAILASRSKRILRGSLGLMCRSRSGVQSIDRGSCPPPERASPRGGASPRSPKRDLAAVGPLRRLVALPTKGEVVIDAVATGLLGFRKRRAPQVHHGA